MPLPRLAAGFNFEILAPSFLLRPASQPSGLTKRVYAVVEGRPIRKRRRRPAVDRSRRFLAGRSGSSEGITYGSVGLDGPFCPSLGSGVVFVCSELCFNGVN